MSSFTKQNVKFNKIYLEIVIWHPSFVIKILKLFAMLPDLDSFYASVAEQIKFERIKKKVNQQALADHLGLSRTSMINIETGRHRPSVYQLVQIANYLEIDYTILIPLKQKKQPATRKMIAVDVKRAVIDEGALDKSQQTAVNNFLSDIN